MQPRRYAPAALLTSLVVAGIVVAAVVLTRPSISGNTASSFQVPVIERLFSPVPSPTPEPPEPPVPQLDLTASVTVKVDGFLHWAALDRRTGEIATSADPHATSTTESMIKVWIVADYLRRTAKAGDEPTERALTDASRAIRDSHDGGAERLYAAGGRNAVVKRMIDICGLTDTEIYPYWWSRTKISALDTVRLGECIADGRAAGPEWTDWVLEQMRKVRGSTDPADQPMSRGGEGGRWGIIDGLPAELVEEGVAIKNGWTAIGRTNAWHVACLAIHDDWVMGVVMQYNAGLGLEYGAQRCASVAAQLVPWDEAEVG